MSNQVKFNTVLPNNTIERVMNFTAVSQVYLDKSNVFGPLEHQFDANDIEFSFNTVTPGALGTVYIPPSIKLIKCLWLRIRTTYPVNRKWGVLECIERIEWRLPGSPRQIIEGYNLLFHFLRWAKDTMKWKAFRDAIGRKFYPDNQVSEAPTGLDYWFNRSTDGGFEYFMPIPLPNLCLDPQQELGMFPNHLLSQPLEITVTWKSVNQGGFTPTAASVVCQYRDLADMTEYKNVVYNYPCVLHYDTFIDAVSSPQNINRFPDVPNDMSQGALNILATTTTPWKYQYRLNGLKNGEVTEIAFRIGQGSLGGSNNHANVMHDGVFVMRYQLEYAGRILYDSYSGSAGQAQMLALSKHPSTLIDFHSNLWNLTGTSTRSNLGAGLPYDAPVHSMTSTFYYTIPIATRLDEIRGADYGLGADFRDSDLLLSVWLCGMPADVEAARFGYAGGTDPVVDREPSPVNAVGMGSILYPMEGTCWAPVNYVPRLFVQVSCNAIIQFDGRNGQIIQ
jgi:hypothetical protein